MTGLFDVAAFGSAFVSLLVILDPPGALPVFLGLTRTFTHKQRIAVARRAASVALGVLLAFAFLGQQILGYLKISLPALQISGGLLLLLLGFELVTGRESGGSSADKGANIALVPLAVPLYAGPGVLVAIMVAVQRAAGPAQYVSVIAALVAAMGVVWLTMRYAGVIHRVLRDSGTTLVSRIAGLLCAAIAVQMMADGALTLMRQGG